MHRLNSSYRAVPPTETLARAQRMGGRLGVTRVTDTTRLDRIGIPVFAAIRPDAAEHSLCVNAGKGVRSIEAQVGAYMEAIEYAVAERSAKLADVYNADARDVLGRGSRAGVIELCPVFRAQIDADGPIECIDAEELVSGTTVPLPSELVFFPYWPRTGSPIYGSTTNGLASGNTIEEATLHALFEVIERDITAFNRVLGDARRVAHETLPGPARALIEKITAADCLVSVREFPNDFGIPMFECYLKDQAGSAIAALAGGFGCHADPDIAIVRAITEACQSRLSMIHGGRDDLARADVLTGKVPAAVLDRNVDIYFGDRTRGESISYEEVRASVVRRGSLRDLIEGTIERLLSCDIAQVCRVTLTDAADELQVVRVVVPTLEFHSGAVVRVGPRLLGRLHAQSA